MSTGRKGPDLELPGSFSSCYHYVVKTDCHFWWNWWVNFAVAFGTLLLAAVALFGDKLASEVFPAAIDVEGALQSR